MKPRILLLNQSFYPDVVSTAQHLSDLARGLAASGADVTVVCSRRGYDNPDEKFPAHESWNGITIHRVPTTGFGKGAKWRRACDFASFLFFAAMKLITLGRFDVVVALTSPPIVACLGAMMSKLWGARFVYWVMDLNPDEALAANWLRPGSLAARFLEACSRFSFRRAESIVVLDRFMAAKIEAKGIPAEKIGIIPPWSHDEAVSFDAAARQRFRREHGLEDAFVVMYAGNHSPCHPLETLLEAARALQGRSDIRFCFLGGGSEHRKISGIADREKLTNIVTLPYQPLEALAGALSAADLQVAVMGDPFVGTIHPCKVYNILQVQAPLLYIGPDCSHIADILSALPASEPFCAVRHGEPEFAVRFIESLTGDARRGSYGGVATRYRSIHLVPQLLEVVLRSRRADETVAEARRD